MNCPVDGTELRMTERQGVEIDYCPQCRGVWLDRGELDKIIERGGSYFEQPREVERQRPEHREPYQRHRKKNPLSELFDF